MGDQILRDWCMESLKIIKIRQFADPFVDNSPQLGHELRPLTLDGQHLPILRGTIGNVDNERSSLSQLGFNNYRTV